MLVLCGNVVIGCSNNSVRIMDINSTVSDTAKSLGACNFMNEMPIDIENLQSSLKPFNHMLIPNFIK
jgi:hypothetical protein